MFISAIKKSTHWLGCVLVRENALDIEAPLCSVELQRGITKLQGITGNKKPRDCEVWNLLVCICIELPLWVDTKAYPDKIQVIYKYQGPQ